MCSKIILLALLLFFSLSPMADAISFERARAEGRVEEMNWGDKLSYLWKYLRKDNEMPTLREFPLTQEQKEVPAGAAVKLAFVGDLMWIRNDWESFLSPEVKKLLLSFDGVLGNLETIISPSFPVSSFWPDLFRYNSPASLLQTFQAEHSPFAALSIANNHILDFGDQGALETKQILTQMGVPSSGISQRKEKAWTSFTRKGIRFGFYAATFGVNEKSRLKESKIRLEILRGLAPDNKGTFPQLDAVESALKEMKQENIDVKIVSVHWGHEFEFTPTQKIRQMAKGMVALGADIIIGSHPHLYQPEETCYVNTANSSGCSIQDGSKTTRKAKIFYSMGNFTTAMYTELCRIAIMRSLSFFRTKTKQIDWVEGEAFAFYNQARTLQQSRKLIPLSEKLAGCEQNKAGSVPCPRETLQAWKTISNLLPQNITHHP